MKLETKVGAFFVGTIVVIGGLILKMEKVSLFNKKTNHELVVDFDQVAGLNPQSKVRVAGVAVGEVRSITVDGSRAKVALGLPDDFPVYADAVASLSSIGILGEKYIDLDPGHPQAGPIGAVRTIASKTGVSMDKLMETLQTVSENVKGVTGALNQSIGGEAGRQKMDEIVDNIRQLTGEFRLMAQENHAAINTTLANTQAISTELKDRLPRIAQQFEDLGRSLNSMVDQSRPEIAGLMGDVRKLAQSFQATSENVRAITDGMNKGEGTLGKLLKDEATIKKINLAVDNVNEMLGGFKTMDLRLDMNVARWTKRGDSRIGLGIDIVPRHDYWYALELGSTPDGKLSDSSRLVQKLDPVTGLPTSVVERTRTVTTDQSFTVSAQFAKRLAEHFVLTAGLVEGKGGGGAEVRFLEDRLRLGLLAYDFTKRDDKEKPRYRATGSYQFHKNLYLQTGVQDIANKELRTFFVGGGLRWKDDDLKKLVGLMGSAK